MSSPSSGPPTPTPPPPTPPPTPPPAPTPPPTPPSPPTPTLTDQGVGLGISPLSPSPADSDSGQGYVTATDSGAAQLLSSAFPDGLPNPYNPDQAGWSTDAPAGRPLHGRDRNRRGQPVHRRL